jgi:hypothetical protein
MSGVLEYWRAGVLGVRPITPILHHSIVLGATAMDTSENGRNGSREIF